MFHNAAVARAVHADCQLDQWEHPAMVRKLTFVIAALICAAAAQAEGVVRLARQPDSIVVTIDEREFTVYRTAKNQAKPYFFPVRAAGGANVARKLENPEDHPHHKGIWCAIDEVNGIKYWAEQGKIECAAVELVEAAGNPARLRLVNHWLDDQGSPLLAEQVLVSIFANRLLIYDLSFTALDRPVTFGDTKEGMFGIRVADSLRGRAGGKILNAEGRQGEKECWGQESKWVDYSGQVEGRTCGVAIFDLPENFRRSRFHVRDYGLFTLSPFGQSAYTNGQLPADPFTLMPEKTARLTYGLYVHDGDAETARVPEVYEQFLKSAR